MGRNTPPFRQHFSDTVSKLRKEFQEDLLSVDRRKAFDQLVQAWSAELGAMSFAESIKLLGLLLLTAAIDTRSLLEKLKHRFEGFEERILRIEDHIS